MKKTKVIVSLIAAFVLMFTSLSVAVSADSGFVIDSGVLIEYNGTSSSVIIPDEVYRIEDGAFINNKNIQSVDLNNVSSVGNESFRGCTSLKTVTNYDNLTSCGAYAFWGTPFFTGNTSTNLIMGSVLVNSRAKGNYTIDSNVYSIAPYAFSGNTSLTGITVGSSVYSVGEGAFYNCSALKDVNVSSQVSYIGPLAFEGTSFLSTNTTEFLTLGNGVLIDYNGKGRVVTIPEGVKQIAGGTFYNNSKITTVSFPATVSGIGMRAFAGCTSLSALTLPEGLVLLDKEAFSGCTSLKTVTVPASVEIIGDSVFFGCKGLKEVKYMSDANISRGMFASCSKLTSVWVAAKIKSVEELAFYNCSELEEISMPDTVSFISSTAFDGALKVSVWCDSSSYASKELEQKGIKVYQTGDANTDTNFNIKDATHIQKATAGLVTMDFSSSIRADVDFSGEINVRDATWVQKKLAGII